MHSQPGILEPSTRYFTTSGANAPSWFLSLLCTGLYRCDGRYATRRANFESGLIMQVLEGRGYVLSGGLERTLQAGDLCLVDCYSPHIYGTHTGWKILWAHFAGDTARHICSSVEGGAKILRPGPEGLGLYRLLHSLLDQFEGGPQLDDAAVHCALTELTAAFFRTPAPTETSADLDRITAYLTENISRSVSNADLAQLVHVSESQLIRLFQQRMGTTPHQYLLRLRLNAAQYYLASTDLTLSQIAQQCGFTDASALTNRFRKAFGYTPREYARRSLGQSEEAESTGSEE
ncbi:MAG: helix-turn-helix domain-containing protein [Clostridia bacterium]|nr:helix-turn-helix domain-containing protein [Clostridia bacterium]